MLWSLRKQSLADRVVQLLLIGFTVLIFGSVVQNYFMSIQAVNEEVQRNIVQTSEMTQVLLDYKLAALQTHQEVDATSQTLHRFYADPASTDIDRYFFELEQKDPLNTPDFRFLTRNGQLIWDDGGSIFYGIDMALLQDLVFNHKRRETWFYQSLSTEVGLVNLLVRRTPVLDPDIGMVKGYFFIAVVLNNNFTLLDELGRKAHADAIILVNGNHIIATNLHLYSSIYKNIAEQLQSGRELIAEKQLIYRVPIAIDGGDNLLEFIILEDNHNLESLHQSFLYKWLVSLVALFFFVFTARKLVAKQLSSSLDKLMAFLDSAGVSGCLEPYPDSDIIEFNRIGKSFEKTFNQLAVKEQALQDLFDYALSPIVVWNSDVEIERINPSARQLLNYSEPDGSMSEIYSQFRNTIDSPLQRALDGEVIWELSVEVQGREFFWNLAPVVVDGEVRSIIAQGLDITTLVDAEYHSRQAQFAAEASAHAKSDFMARMSHEIRTPLNGILGLGQILSDSNNDPKLVQQLEILQQSGEHLLSIVNDILDFSRIEQGKLKVEKIEFALINLLSSVEGMFKAQCERKGLTFILSHSIPETLQIKSDKAKLTQILMNLLNNAVKFTHQGRITLRVDIEGCSNQECLLCFEIQDSGIGIREQRMNKLFDPFVQAESSTTREYGGSGLGLSIVKSLVELLGGKVDVESVIKQGSIFRVRVPVDVAKEASAQLPPVNHVDQSLFNQPVKTLLVEDDATNAYICKVFCEKNNLEVDWVKSGTEAIERVQCQEYDLILMDNHMPQLSGIEATHIIKNQLCLDIPIYACTADAFEQTRQDFLDAGAAYILVKPIMGPSFNAALEFFKLHHYRRSVDSEPSLQE